MGTSSSPPSSACPSPKPSVSPLSRQTPGRQQGWYNGATVTLRPSHGPSFPCFCMLGSPPWLFGKAEGSCCPPGAARPPPKGAGGSHGVGVGSRGYVPAHTTATGQRQAAPASGAGTALDGDGAPWGHFAIAPWTGDHEVPIESTKRWKTQLQWGGGGAWPAALHTACRDARYGTAGTLPSAPTCTKAVPSPVTVSPGSASPRPAAKFVQKNENKKKTNKTTTKKARLDQKRCGGRAQRCPAPNGSVPAVPGLVAGKEGTSGSRPSTRGHPGAFRGQTSAKASPHCSCRLPQRRATMAR